MAPKFEDLINDMVNIGFGVAATAAEKGKEVLDDLNAKGADARAEARDQAAKTDFSRSMADIFQQAGGVFSDVTERLSSSGASVAERILDELILARVRGLTSTERIEFLAHVRDLVDSADEGTVHIEVETVEAEAAEEADAEDAPVEADEEQGA